ncbi:hypothetical protein DFH94DRAFT_685909 [Russula ochroleuca]|uniref:Uncharacterized protein n=1 Tax=Russula ochroleuca TaxID=152965 RepID=A0A9P5JX43_9AGAM|nr:hypothetical protein DFH94DRAFT_685909 [Russula ochroleuca]
MPIKYIKIQLSVTFWRDVDGYKLQFYSRHLTHPNARMKAHCMLCLVMPPNSDTTQMDSNIPFRAGTNTGMGTGHVMSCSHFSDFEECTHILVYAPLTVTVLHYNLCLEISTQLCVKTFHSAMSTHYAPSDIALCAGRVDQAGMSVSTLKRMKKLMAFLARMRETFLFIWFQQGMYLCVRLDGVVLHLQRLTLWRCRAVVEDGT